MTGALANYATEAG
ncbi:unnamed protein product [Timema podura]|nr:unnamed protein product [Timema podura]